MQTIGSPRTLKLVLTQIASPVGDSKAFRMAWKAGWVSRCTVCTRAEQSTWVTAGMSERGRWTVARRSRSPPRSASGSPAIRRASRTGPPAACRARADRGRSSPRPVRPARRGERTEALPELDLQVHHRLHPRRAGVPQDRAGAQRPGPELHPPLEESHDLTLGDAPGHLVRPRLRRRLVEGDALGLQVLPDLDPPRTPAPGRCRAWRRRPDLSLRAGSSRLCPPPAPPRARRRRRPPPAGSRGRRRSPAQQPAVGHAVERHAAGQAEVPLAGELPGVGREAPAPPPR